ncbi:MAG: RsmE family RNA methyltransferase [Gemmatimonadales bacterium]
MITVLVPAGVHPAGSRASIEEGEAHHLRVRRVAAGEPVELRDGAGLVGTGRTVQEGRSWLVEVESVAEAPRPAALTLAVGAGDRERFGWLVEKATELGVTTIVPLETERTSGVATRVRPPHLDKLRRQALEVLKQCGAAWAPAVEEPIALEEFLRRPRAGALWLADPAGQLPATRLDTAPVTVVVGPEGGMSERERAALLTAGYHPRVLGPHILRFETAALAAVVAVTTARLRGIHG